VSTSQFEREYQIVSLFIDSAKSYGQLSAAALALLAYLSAQLLGGSPVVVDNKLLIAASFCFLAATLAAGAYQALAAGRLESLSGLPIRRARGIPESWFGHSFVAYQAMMLAFYLGAGFLAAVVVR